MMEIRAISGSRIQRVRSVIGSACHIGAGDSSPKQQERSSVMLSWIFIWKLYGAVILKEMINPGVSRKNAALLIIIPTGISIGS